MVESYNLYQEKQSGFFSTFPFGVFAYSRLDERLEKEEVWQNAHRPPNRDPMHLLPSQPHIEWLNSELYLGIPHFKDFPKDNQYGFQIIVMLFSPRSRGTVKIRSKDPFDKPIIDNRFMKNELDMLVQSEGVRFANEVMTTCTATKAVIKGFWPQGQSLMLYRISC